MAYITLLFSTVRRMPLVIWCVCICEIFHQVCSVIAEHLLLFLKRSTFLLGGGDAVVRGRGQKFCLCLIGYNTVFSLPCTIPNYTLTSATVFPLLLSS